VPVSEGRWARFAVGHQECNGHRIVAVAQGPMGIMRETKGFSTPPELLAAAKTKARAVSL